MYGSVEDGKWHPILFFTLDVEKLGNRQRTSVLEPEFHEIKSEKNSDKLDSIDRWCILHPGNVRFLGGHGFRHSYQRVRNLYTSGDVFNHNPMFPCTLAALVNSVYIQDGAERAKIVKNTRPMPTSRHLKDLQKWLKDKIGFVSLDKIREYDGSEKKHF